MDREEDDGTPEERAQALRAFADRWYALAPFPVAATYVEDPRDVEEKIFVVSISLEPVNFDPIQFGEMLSWALTNAAALAYDIADFLDPEHLSRRPPPKSRSSTS